MRRSLLICAAVIALACASSAAATPPLNGTFVPGRSLGGVRLGETAAQVRAALGKDYGVCRGCAATTWYFTYKPFTRKGLAVELTGGRVSAVWTVWQPKGWRDANGLRLGTSQERVIARGAALLPLTCYGYEALVTDSSTARSAYYIVAGTLWGFGLLQRQASPCR
jgi:hypothetical protein